MHVRIYTRTTCPYSLGAKRLLDEKGIAFEEIDIERAPERRDEMIAATGGPSTVPQVFFGGRHVGGYAELQELDRRGGLRGAVRDAEAP